MHRAIKGLARGLGVEITRFDPCINEATRLHRLLHLLEVDLVFDVGANRGQFARRLRRGGYTGAIVSFEPQSEAHADLVMAARRDSSWVVAPKVALGPQEGEAQIFCSENSVSSSVLPMHDLHRRMAPRSRVDRTETVRMRRLDQVAAPYLVGMRSVFLKLDVQGYESQVFDGASTLVPRLVGLQVELSLVPLFEGQCLMPEMMLHMRKRGFTPYGFVQGFTDARTGRQLQVDGLFARADVLKLDGGTT